MKGAKCALFDFRSGAVAIGLEKQIPRLPARHLPDRQAVGRPATPARDEPFGRATIYFTQEKVEGMMRVRMCPAGVAL